VKDNRALLDDPDPVAPLTHDLEDALRAALSAKVEAFRQAREAGIAELNTDEDFSALSDERCRQIVEQCGLRPVDMPKVDTDEALLQVLDQYPLARWDDRIAGLRERFERARQMAAAELEPEVRRVTPPKATLKSAADVDAYIDELRGEIMEQIDAGHSVII
jgi:hypothetical protein